MIGWLFSDMFDRFPGLQIVLSEGNIGWMPYFIERAEQVVDKQRHWAKRMNLELYGDETGAKPLDPVPQADLDTLDVRRRFRDHIYGCFIEETAGLRCLDIIGEDNVMIETDYPHSDTTWPDSIEVATRLVKDLPPATQRKILRGNAERLFRFTPIAPAVSAAG